MSKPPAPSRPPSARDRILEAATRLFWREGYYQVSTDAICSAASVRKGSLYHAFPQKADVLAACLEGVWLRDWSDIQAIYSGPGTAEAKLRAHLEWFANSQRKLKAQHGIVLGNFDMALGVSIPEPVMQARREHQVEHIARLKASIMAELQLGPEDDAQAAWLTEVVAQLISGALIRARLNNDLAPLERLPDTVLQLIRAVPRPPAPSRSPRRVRAKEAAGGAPAEAPNPG